MHHVKVGDYLLSRNVRAAMLHLGLMQLCEKTNYSAAWPYGADLDLR
jgi:hypothetical protein